METTAKLIFLGTVAMALMQSLVFMELERIEEHLERIQFGITDSLTEVQATSCYIDYWSEDAGSDSRGKDSNAS